MNVYVQWIVVLITISRLDQPCWGLITMSVYLSVSLSVFTLTILSIICVPEVLQFTVWLLEGTFSSLLQRCMKSALVKDAACWAASGVSSEVKCCSCALLWCYRPQAETHGNDLPFTLVSFYLTTLDRCFEQLTSWILPTWKKVQWSRGSTSQPNVAYFLLLISLRERILNLKETEKAEREAKERKRYTLYLPVCHCMIRHWIQRPVIDLGSYHIPTQQGNVNGFIAEMWNVKFKQYFCFTNHVQEDRLQDVLLSSSLSFSFCGNK